MLDVSGRSTGAHLRVARRVGRRLDPQTLDVALETREPPARARVALARARVCAYGRGRLQGHDIAGAK